MVYNAFNNIMQEIQIKFSWKRSRMRLLITDVTKTEKCGIYKKDKEGEKNE